MKKKSLESAKRRKERIEAAPKMRTRIAEDKTKYKRAREKQKTREESWGYIQGMV